MVTLFLGLAQIWNLQEKTEQENFRELLKDVGSSEASTRLSAVSRLSTFHSRKSILDSFFSWLTDPQPAEGINEQIIVMVKHALWLEPALPVKVAMLDLLESKYDMQAVDPLKDLRIELIRELKGEHAGKNREYWSSLRETLFLVAVSLSRLTDSPPDFRCFPLKGIQLRQWVLPEGADFSGATLSLAEIWGGSFPGAKFSKANLFQAKLRHVDFTGALFKEADLLNTEFGPQLSGLEPEMFADSNWPAADWGNMAHFLEQLKEMYGADEGGDVSAADRDAHCAKLLSEEFEVQ